MRSTSMTIFSRAATAIFLSLSAWTFLLGPAPAQATVSTDTFELKLTFKEWCQGNPKFFENFNIKTDPNNPSANTTLTIIRDDSSPTDIQATIETHGRSADVDAITLSGRAVLSNAAGRKAEFALSGMNPGNPNHFLMLRGQATLDKFGNVTKVTGTFMLQETNTYTIDKKTGQQSAPAECFASGTFNTGKEAGGTLTVTNAPSSVEGTLVANAYLTKQIVTSGVLQVIWSEQKENKIHHEQVGLIFDINGGQGVAVIFGYHDVNEAPNDMGWGCSDIPIPFLPPMPLCAGVAVNRTAGTLTLSGTVLDGIVETSSQITLDGTLTFRPF